MPACGRSTSDRRRAGARRATYNHLYWDFPCDPPGRTRYSMVRDLALAGYATFNIDQVDAGQSRTRLSSRVTTEREADVLHQLVTGLRAGQLGLSPDALMFPPFAKVVTVGHSSGSLVAITEAATYRDVDGLIATGALAHRFNLSGAVTECLMPPSGFQPAILDPKFANSGLDPGYLTAGPAFRETCMHDPENRDATVVALDEENKDTVSATGQATLAQNINNTANVATPCAAAGRRTRRAVLRRDRRALHGSKRGGGRASVLPAGRQPRGVRAPARAGHAMNLAPNASEWYAAAIGWLDRRVGGASPAG